MIQSLLRSMELLEVLKEKNRNFSIAELAEAMDLPPSTVHRILQTFCEKKYVIRDDRSHTYRLGPALIPLGKAAARGIRLQDAAHGILAQLAKQTKEDAYLVIPVGNKGLVIEKVDGPSHLKVVEEFGYEMYMHCGAIRKVLLAWQTPAFIDEYFKNIILHDQAFPHVRPDDHYQDLKRIIGATASTAHRINVIMPFLYESRQHKRTHRESLDCAMALEELVSMGVSNIITFDAHDPRVQNAIPLSGLDNFMPTYQFVKALFKHDNTLKIDKDHLMVISPDEGATNRAIYLANVLGIDMGMFYKRRDFSRVVDGRNPIVAHEFLGSNVEGKDVLIIDDMISSGESMIDTARELKKRKANRIFVVSTFGLFTNGLASFDKAYEEGLIYRVVTTNLIYQTPELLSREYYISCDMSKYIAYIIDTLNHDSSISDLLNPYDRIKNYVKKYNDAKNA